MVFGKQDTHVDRAGRSLIRDTLDEGGGAVSVSPTRECARGGDEEDAADSSSILFPSVL